MSIEHLLGLHWLVVKKRCNEQLKASTKASHEYKKIEHNMCDRHCGVDLVQRVSESAMMSNTYLSSARVSSFNFPH